VNVIEILADEGVNNFGDTRGGGLAGPTGLFIILVLAVATILLVRNMSKRIRRLPAEFPRTGDAVERSAQSKSEPTD
jgi:hypothetical protein